MTPHQANKLPFREMLAFGCGDFASVLYWQTFMRYLPYYYTEVFGITAGALATMLLISRIWDGVNDPIIGMWADRTESRWGKFRPFILYGCVPFAILGVLTFTTPGFGMTGKLIWAYLTYNGLMMLYTTVNIPYTALMGVMTNNPVERTRLSSIKFIFAFTAGMVISATLLPMVSALGGDRNPQLGWQLAFAVVGVVAIGFFLITVFGTKERIKPRPEAHPSVLRDLRFLVTNNAWVLLLCTTLTWILFIAVRSSVSAHYFKYYLYNGSPDTPLQFLGRGFTLDVLLSSFNTLGQAASVAGVLVTSLIASRFPKKGLFIALFLLQIANYLAYLFLEPGQLGLIFTLEIVGSFFGAPLPVLMWAMYADTADYGEWKSGRRTTALVFSASTMSQKFGWALAAFLAFQLLQFVGFQANVVPSEAVKGSLVRLMSIYPAVLGLISIVIFLFYPLSEKRMAEINADLKSRHDQAAPTPA
ncbi:MAG: MFS transporter [Lacunisphaera sp.]|nr:MFS transporter [Lacunisphaera sp.]